MKSFSLPYARCFALLICFLWFTGSCDYLRKKFATINDRAIGQCLCLCDDDNDIEMAMSCMHAYLPTITSATMRDYVESHPEKFTVTSTSTDGGDGIEAAESALALVLKRLDPL